MPRMPRSNSSVGVSTAVMASQEEPIQPTYRGYGTIAPQRPAQRQRRHSWHTRPCMQEAENFQLLVSKSVRMRLPCTNKYVASKLLGRTQLPDGLPGRLWPPQVRRRCRIRIQHPACRSRILLEDIRWRNRGRTTTGFRIRRDIGGPLQRCDGTERDPRREGLGRNSAYGQLSDRV